MKLFVESKQASCAQGRISKGEHATNLRMTYIIKMPYVWTSGSRSWEIVYLKGGHTLGENMCMLITCSAVLTETEDSTHPTADQFDVSNFIQLLSID